MTNNNLEVGQEFFMVGSKRRVIDRGEEGPHERCENYFDEEAQEIDTTAQMLIFSIRKALPKGSTFNIPIANQDVGVLYSGCTPDHTNVQREAVNVIAPECSEERRTKCGDKCIQIAMKSADDVDRSLAEISSYRESATPLDF